MKTTAFFILTVLIAFAAVPGCSGGGSSSEAVSQWVEHGDPGSLAEGYDDNVAMTHDQLKSLEGWVMRAVVQFSRRSRNRDAEILREQDPAKRSLSKITVYPLKFRTTEEGAELYDGKSLSFKFKRVSAELYQLQSIGNQPALLAFASLHNEKRWISFLFKDQDQLAAVYFSQDKEVEVLSKPTFPKYKYFVYPAGRWTEPSLKIAICGFPSRANTQLALDAVQAWRAVLVGRLNLSAVVANACAPFSDLNQHSIIWNDGFRTLGTKDYINAAHALPLVDHGQQRILDADVFVFTREILKQHVDDRQKMLRRTLIHEVGHVLGLDHEFNGAASIMSYDGKIETIQKHDVEALHGLYPLL